MTHPQVRGPIVLVVMGCRGVDDYHVNLTYQLKVSYSSCSDGRPFSSKLQYRWVCLSFLSENLAIVKQPNTTNLLQESATKIKQGKPSVPVTGLIKNLMSNYEGWMSGRLFRK